MKFISSAILLATSTTLASAALNDAERVFFDNRSSSKISIYRAPLSSGSQPVKQLAPGEVFGTKSSTHQQWVAASPIWYRLVGSARPGKHNRAVIRDSDIKAIGTKPLDTKFTNQASAPIDVKILVAGKELDWIKVGAGKSVKTISFADQKWVIRDSKTGKVIQRATTPATASTIEVTANSKPVAATKSKPKSKPAPKAIPRTASKKITHEVHNDTKSTVFIYQQDGEQLVFVSRLPAGKKSKLPSEAGKVISIRDAKTKEELKRMKSPARASALHIEPLAATEPAKESRPQKRGLLN